MVIEIVSTDSKHRFTSFLNIKEAWEAIDSAVVNLMEQEGSDIPAEILKQLVGDDILTDMPLQPSTINCTAEQLFNLVFGPNDWY